MKCSLCGFEFREKDGEAACEGCPLVGACYMVKCPNCGYDLPTEPRLIKAFKAWREQSNGTK